MIVGEVTASGDAVIHISIQGGSGEGAALECVIDTGFTDFLTVPSAVIAQLGLKYRESMEYELADGQLHSFDLFAAQVYWNGRWREIIVSSAEGGTLVGMALLRGCEVNLKVIPGGQVTIRPMNDS